MCAWVAAVAPLYVPAQRRTGGQAGGCHRFGPDKTFPVSSHRVNRRQIIENISQFIFERVHMCSQLMCPSWLVVPCSNVNSTLLRDHLLQLN